MSDLDDALDRVERYRKSQDDLRDEIAKLQDDYGRLMAENQSLARQVARRGEIINEMNAQLAIALAKLTLGGRTDG